MRERERETETERERARKKDRERQRETETDSPEFSKCRLEIIGGFVPSVSESILSISICGYQVVISSRIGLV